MTSSQLQEFARIAASAYQQGKHDIAADIVLTLASKNMVHHHDDDMDSDPVFLKSLREQLDKAGFVNLLKISRERASQITKPLQTIKYPYKLSTKLLG